MLQEPIQRFLQGKDAEQVQMTAISIQKAREAENQKYIDSFVPLTALEINNKIDQPGMFKVLYEGLSMKVSRVKQYYIKKGKPS